MKCKRRFMHGKRRKRSPIKNDVDTTFADAVYSKTKVDESLTKSGHHTEGDLRGKIDTTPGQGANIASGAQAVNPNMFM